MSGRVGAFVLGAGAGILLGVCAWVVWRALAARPRAPLADPAAGRRAELTSKIAHELKNPIMSVKGLASSGIRLYDSMSDDERREFFGLIDAEANRLGAVADEISTALRIDAGRIVYDVGDHDVGTIVQEVAWRTPVGGHAMVVEVDDGLKAHTDPARLAEVLERLIDNAAKFSPPDEPIEITARKAEGGGAVVEVVDRGPSIPPGQREAVFGEFAEWRPAGYEETPGAGLGLFICRAHLKAMGGTIDIDEGWERGSALRVTLPGG